MKNMYSITSDMREMMNFRDYLIGESFGVVYVNGEACETRSRAKAALIDTIDTFIHNEIIRQFKNEKND